MNTRLMESILKQSREASDRLVTLQKHLDEINKLLLKEKSVHAEITSRITYRLGAAKYDMQDRDISAQRMIDLNTQIQSLKSDIINQQQYILNLNNQYQQQINIESNTAGNGLFAKLSSPPLVTTPQGHVNTSKPI